MAGILLWKGPLVRRVNERTGEERVDFLEDRFSMQAVDTVKLNNFFMNPETVSRNMFVCGALVNYHKLI